MTYTLQQQRYLDAGTGIPSSSGTESSKAQSSRGREAEKHKVRKAQVTNDSSGG